MELMRNGWFGKAAFSIGLASATSSWNFEASLGAAMFGLACGHLFDLWATGELLTTIFATTRTHHRNSGAGPDFMRLTFTGLGDISRAEPSQQGAHLRYVEQLSKRLRLDRRARKDAMRWFLQGRGPNCDFTDIIAACSDGYARTPLLANMAMECFCACALLGGAPSSAQQLRLQAFAAALGAPASRIGLLLRELAPIASRAACGHASHAGSKSVPANPNSTDNAAERDALALLGLSRDASESEVKQAYRRFVARHHPDKLPTDCSARKQREAQQNMQIAQDALTLLQARNAR